MNIRKAYIRHQENYPESANNYAAMDGFRILGVETVPYYGFGDIQTLDDLGPEVCISGYIGDIWEALTKLNKPIPPPIDYPEEIKFDLGREIEKKTLADVRSTTKTIFVKPIKQKLFSGFVWTGSKIDRLHIATYEDDTEVYISPPVKFLSEYRCFILDGEIIGVKHYKGDWSVAPNKDTIKFAVKHYKSSPRAYTLDFGITMTGPWRNSMLLVEANDGYAVGNYGLNSVLYAKFLAARWEELMQ